MPEGRPFPYKYLPKPGANLTITFGEPVPVEDIQQTLSTLVSEKRIPEAPRSTSGGLGDPARPSQEMQSALSAEHGWLGGPVSQFMQGDERNGCPRAAMEVARVRSAVTAVIQRDVEALGRRVLGITG